MTSALAAIIEGNLWQLDRQFKSFGDFAVTLPPDGLGVRSIEPLRLLRHALLNAGFFTSGPRSSNAPCANADDPQKVS